MQFESQVYETELEAQETAQQAVEVVRVSSDTSVRQVST